MSIYDIGLEPRAANRVARSPVSFVERSAEVFGDLPAYMPQEGMTVMNAETLSELPADGSTMGAIMFRGNIVMKGYLKNPAATAKAFEGGWFRTGDLGVIEPDRYVKIKDRGKDIIAHCKALLAGYKVPREVRFEPIPKTSTGKIQKFTRRECAASGPDHD